MDLAALDQAGCLG